MSRVVEALSGLRSLDALAGRRTRLSDLDARAKLVTTLAFVLTVVSYPRYTLAGLLPLAAYPVALAALGNVPLRPLWRKLAFAAPFAVMVGIFNPLLDPGVVVVAGDLTISAGWLSFASILLRFALTVAAALLLLAVTGIHDLATAFARLGLPRIFATQLLFMYRYAFVIGEQAARMLDARELRACGRRLELRLYGRLLGQLLLRSFERAQRIYQAMLARGFDGELRAVHRSRWTARETRFVIGWCAFFIVARLFDLPALIGAVTLLLVP